MSEPTPSPLPRVKQTDILSLVMPEILDPKHTRQWEELAISNPDLAREILIRATIESKGRPDEQKRLIDMALFASSALGEALRRNKSENDSTASDGGASLQPSSE